MEGSVVWWERSGLGVRLLRETMLDGVDPEGSQVPGTEAGIPLGLTVLI